MRTKKNWVKWLRKKIVQLLVIVLIVGQIMPFGITAMASEGITPLPVAEDEELTEEMTEEVQTIEEVATEEVATEEVATEEVATEEVKTEEVTTEEVVTEEVKTEEVTTEEVVTEEVVTEEVATEEIVTEEVTTEEVTTEEMTEGIEYVRLVLHAPEGCCEQNEILVNLEDKQVILPDCHMDGFAFLGWYLDEEGTILFQIDDLYWINGLEYDLFAIFEKEQKEIELEERMINMSANGVLITVYGKLPTDAYLQVTTMPVDEVVKNEIVRISDKVESVRDFDEAPLLYSYDISICSGGKEYEPYVFGEEVEVRFTHMSRTVLSDMDYIEVFHVSEQYGVECVELTNLSEYEVVVTVDEFSQYIVIGQVEHSYETYWEFGYQKSEQSFTAPVKGVYKIALYGAQGGCYGDYQGGLGGMVSAYVELEKNQTIEILTGEHNSFLGGNYGSVSKGGGATELKISGELVAVAGGGGGASIQGDGGKGGLSTETQEVNKMNRGPVTETFGGGAGYTNGQDGYVLLHEHTGNAVEGGGCYTKTSYIYHSHKTNGCKYVKQRCTSTDYLREGWWPQVQGEQPSEHVICRKCGAGHIGPRDGSAGFDYGRPCGNVISQYWECGKTENALDGVEFTLGCEKDETTVDGMVMSTGGSNFYQTQVCKNVATAAGLNEGNGRAAITLTEIEAATIYYYENTTELLTSVSVEKGTMAAYPLVEVPQRATDSKYSYTFAGWDDMATQETEKLQAHQTVESVVLQDRSYMAVYDKTPRSYTVTLQQDNVDTLGTQQIIAQYGIGLPSIDVPKKEQHIFAGYYTEQDGSGNRVYREDGTGEQISYFEQDVTLYAYWIAPLEVSKHPADVTVQAGYTFAIMEADGALTQMSGYSLSYQWYICSKEDVTSATPIEGAVGNRCTLPAGYQVGKYLVYCEITATSAYNGQQITRKTELARFVVEKGDLSQNQFLLKTSRVTYDGKPHAIELEIQVQSEVSVYYGEVPLTKENYRTHGTMTPMSYTNVGVYPIYVYVTSGNYRDYTSEVQLVIEKAQPAIYLANRNVAYNKKQQGIGEAVVYGIGQKKLDTKVNYIYYTDEACTQLTTRENGAEQDGDRPSKIGTYYVQAQISETINYKEAKLAQPAMFNIIATKSKFSVKGYHGRYDGKEHGVQIQADDDATVFWFSDRTELTEDNYRQKGTQTPYLYSKPGTYQVYYLAVTKITGWIYDYTPGCVKVVIERVSSGTGNGDDNGENSDGNSGNSGSNSGNAGGTQGGWKPSVNNPNDIIVPEMDVPLQSEYPLEEDEKGKETQKQSQNKKDNTTGEEDKKNIVSTEMDEEDDEALPPESKLLMIMDCLDELTPQELEMLKNYLKQLYPSMQGLEIEENIVDESEQIKQLDELTEKIKKMEEWVVVTGLLGVILGIVIGASIMFVAYPAIHLLLMKKSHMKGKCIERAKQMDVLLETKGGIQKIDKKKNGTFYLPKLKKGETYLLKGKLKNGKTLVLMKMQPQTWNVHYECTEIAGLQMQVKERRGGLRIVIR